MKIVFLDRYSVGDADLSSLFSMGECVCYDDSTQGEVVERAAGAEVIITNKVRVMREEIMALRSSLRLICVAATGVNNVDLEAAREAGVEVRNVPAYSTESVAEATLGMVLGLLRNVGYYDRWVKSGNYSNSGRCFNLDRSISEVKGKRWGVIAMGNIGRRVAEVATVLGAEVVYYSTSGANLGGGGGGYTCLDLPALLGSSDIVTIHAPLNARTQGLIGYEQLQMMRRTAILVNLGRGGIVVESDLAKALDEGLLAGAGLDVFVNEPLERDSALLNVKDQDMLMLAPHCGWSSAEARKVLVGVIVENISTFFAK